MAGASRADRIARILALEIDRMLRQLDDRRAFLLQMWSRHRAREPLLDTLFSRYRTLSAGDLAELDAEVIDALEAFYELHGELVAYARFTEDMPTTPKPKPSLGTWTPRTSPETPGLIPAESLISGVPPVMLPSSVVAPFVARTPSLPLNA